MSKEQKLRKIISCLVTNQLKILAFMKATFKNTRTLVNHDEKYGIVVDLEQDAENSFYQLKKLAEEYDNDSI